MENWCVLTTSQRNITVIKSGRVEKIKPGKIERKQGNRSHWTRERRASRRATRSGGKESGAEARVLSKRNSGRRLTFPSLPLSFYCRYSQEIGTVTARCLTDFKDLSTRNMSDFVQSRGTDISP